MPLSLFLVQIALLVTLLLSHALTPARHGTLLAILVVATATI